MGPLFRDVALRGIPIFLVLFAVLYFSLQTYTYFFTEVFPNENTGFLYGFVVYVFGAWFIELESTNYPKKIYRPFESGLFIYYTFPLYAPYYFIKTRGWRGLAIVFSLSLILLVEWLAYGVFYFFY